MEASSLRAGTITETAGRAGTVSVAGIGRIHYYSWVRRIFCFTRIAEAMAPAFLIIVVLATLTLSGC